MKESGRLRVLLSYSATNRDPLTTLLADALARHNAVRRFSWRTAIIGRYDVLNVHWPEHLTKRHGVLSTVARRVLYTLLLLRVRWGRPVIVRTLHNLRPHEARGGVEQVLLDCTDRQTSAVITMQPDHALPDALPADTAVHHIPQGHYRSLYDGRDSTPPSPGRLLFFGLIRGYKQVPQLLEAFAHLDDPQARLAVVGRTFDEGIGADVRRRAVEDARVTLDLDWVSHDRLAAEVHAAELVVLPYREIFNSGTVLVALSLDRPVLVPRHPTTEALAAEVGPGWVHLYDGDLRAPHLQAALEAARTQPRSARPDLSARDWDAIADAYTESFREALDA